MAAILNLVGPVAIPVGATDGDVIFRHIGVVRGGAKVAGGSFLGKVDMVSEELRGLDGQPVSVPVLQPGDLTDTHPWLEVNISWRGEGVGYSFLVDLCVSTGATAVDIRASSKKIPVALAEQVTDLQALIRRGEAMFAAGSVISSSTSIPTDTIKSVKTDHITVTGDGVTSPLSTPGYDTWIGRFWRRAAGQETIIEDSQHPDRFAKFPTLDLTNYTVGGTAIGFNARLLGIITPRFSEVYTLVYQSDDGIRVWLDDTLVIDNWHNGAKSGSASLGQLFSDRPYSMKIEWYQTVGGESATNNPNRLYLGWSSTSQTEQAIPTIGSGSVSTTTTLPAGGVAGQVLTKQSDIDGDASWATIANGSAVVFCHIYAVSRQDYGYNTWTQVQLTGVLEDASTLARNSQIIIKEAGLYTISAATVFINTGNGTYLNSVVRVNNAGRLQLGEDYANGPSKTLTSGGATRLSAGDVVDLWVYTSGATSWGDASNPDAPRATHLTVAKIG